MPRSRFICLQGGQERAQAVNRSTLIADHGAFAPPRAGLPFQQLFERHYKLIRETCLAFRELGVAVVAVDTARDVVTGSLCLAARADAPAAAVIGRHGQADLFLHEDESLSLRHLLLVVHPVADWDPQRLCYSVLDLRTRTAFEDEQGRRLEGIVSEGPVFLRCGRYALLCLTTGDPTDWPERARDAWEFIPERILLEEAVAEPDRWSRPRSQPFPGPGVPKRRVSYVTVIPGPEWARGPLLGSGEAPVGHLIAGVRGTQTTVPIGRRSVTHGLLLGRYERCDGATLLSDERVSRVHMLIRVVGDRLYAIDTASTHRTYVPDPYAGYRAVRIVPLAAPVDMVLGDGLVHLRWLPSAP